MHLKASNCFPFVRSAKFYFKKNLWGWWGFGKMCPFIFRWWTGKATQSFCRAWGDQKKPSDIHALWPRNPASGKWRHNQRCTWPPPGSIRGYAEHPWSWSGHWQLSRQKTDIVPAHAAGVLEADMGHRPDKWVKYRVCQMETVPGEHRSRLGMGNVGKSLQFGINLDYLFRCKMLCSS